MLGESPCSTLHIFAASACKFLWWINTVLSLKSNSSRPYWLFFDNFFTLFVSATTNPCKLTTAMLSCYECYQNQVYFEIYNSLILQGHEIFSILSDKFSLDGAQKIKTIKAKILVGTLNLHLMSSTTSICFHKIMLHPVWPKFSLEHSPVYSGNYYKNLDRQNLFNLLPCIINNIGK